MPTNNRSAQVSTREIDQTGPTSLSPVGIPALCIAPTELGPAFVPVTVPTYPDFKSVFGGSKGDHKNAALSAREWLRFQQAFTQVRVLGVGNGEQRDGTGKVTNAGFVVGSQQPQSSLSGGLTHNPYATNISSSPDATGSVGRTYFLGCFMSQSAGSTVFTDAGHQGVVLRGILMAPSGVILTLSSSRIGTNTAPSATQAAEWAAGTVHGGVTGSVDSNYNFVMLLNGHKSTTANPNVISCSLDPASPAYFSKILNQDPLKTEEKGHLLYASYDLWRSVAVVTGSGFILQQSGSAGLGAGYEDTVFLVTGSLTRNSGSATVPNYEAFEDRYSNSQSPWVVSQKFGGTYKNLFKVHMLSDDTVNRLVKISIENIVPGVAGFNPYCSFDLIVRAYNDTDTKKVILESWKGVTLNPSSDRYIAKVIGDFKEFFNFETTVDKQKLETTGEYPVNSRYIRVEMNEEVENQDLDASAVPFGFRGLQHLQTSGSAPLSVFEDAEYLQAANINQRLAQPPVPMRLNLRKGSGNSLTSDRNLYWGIQTEAVQTVSTPNDTNFLNPSIASFTKFFPTYQLEWANFAVKDNPGASTTAANGVVDCDLFNNNLFTLDKIRVVYNTTTNLPDLNQLSSWAFVRQGNIATDSGAGTRALAVTDLTDPSTRLVAKFTFVVQGGFSGTNMFNRDTALLTNKAVVEELNNTNRGLTAGATVNSYKKALSLVSDKTEVPMQILVVPGIRDSFITDETMSVSELDRNDVLYLMDIEELDTNANVITDNTSATAPMVNIRNTITNLRNRGLNTSFASAYFPDALLRDTENNTVVRVPPSVAVLGGIAKNDALGYEWTAAAGYARTALTNVDSFAVSLTKQNLDDLYAQSINPLVAFPGEGPVIWGQKTLLATSSVYDRINVRRLMLHLRREVKKVADRVLFQPSLEETLESFSNAVQPILKRVQDLKGLKLYSVRIDPSTTTQADIENKTIKGKIYVVPTKTLEFIDLDFVLTENQLA